MHETRKRNFALLDCIQNNELILQAEQNRYIRVAKLKGKKNASRFFFTI